jgi:hypothetical protein
MLGNKGVPITHVILNGNFHIPRYVTLLAAEFLKYYSGTTLLIKNTLETENCCP